MIDGGRGSARARGDAPGIRGLTGRCWLTSALARCCRALFAAMALAGLPGAAMAEPPPTADAPWPATVADTAVGTSIVPRWSELHPPGGRAGPLDLPSSRPRPGALATGAAPPFDPAREAERRCLALVAYAEAAGEGSAGMDAVVRVMRNRVADPRFPKDACAVALQPGQFQPVGEREALRTALGQPAAADLSRALGGTVDATVLETALALATPKIAAERGDPTKGALFFVNPVLMDPGKCDWFAGLKRTAQIGAHVFMTHYASGEKRGPPALDCSTAGSGFPAAAAGTGAGVRTSKDGRSVRVDLAKVEGDLVVGGTGRRVTMTAPVAPGLPPALASRLAARLEPLPAPRLIWSRQGS